MAVDVRPTTLFSLGTLKAWLKVELNDQDAALARIADRASELIERETGVYFVTRTVSAETYNGDGSRVLRLRRYPVTSITTLTIKDTQDGTPTMLASGDFDLDKERGIIRLRSPAVPAVFTALFQNVAVTYVPGFGAQDDAALPADIYAAGLDLAKMIWDEKQVGAIAASSMSIGPGNVSIKPDLPMHIKNTIDDWRRPLVA